MLIGLSRTKGIKKERIKEAISNLDIEIVQFSNIKKDALEGRLKKALKKQKKSVIIDGINNKFQVELLKKHKDFYLVGVDSSSDKKDSLQLESCLDLADYLIWDNENDLHISERIRDFFDLVNLRYRRPNFEEVFMNTAYLWAKRSTCLRRGIGAILVKENQQLTTGYNGAPSGVKHCKELGCLRNELKIPSGEREEICMAVHAEKNTLLQAGLHGICTKDATLYVTNHPCFTCLKDLVQAGVKEIVYHKHYPNEFAKKLLKYTNVKVRRQEGVTINLFEEIFK